MPRAIETQLYGRPDIASIATLSSRRPRGKPVTFMGRLRNLLARNVPNAAPTWEQVESTQGLERPGGRMEWPRDSPPGQLGWSLVKTVAEGKAEADSLGRTEGGSGGARQGEREGGPKCPPHQIVLVGARGFEPPTTRSRTVCSTRLSYAPTWRTESLHHDCIPRNPFSARGNRGRP